MSPCNKGKQFTCLLTCVIYLLKKKKSIFKATLCIAVFKILPYHFQPRKNDILLILEMKNFLFFS